MKTKSSSTAPIAPYGKGLPYGKQLPSGIPPYGKSGVKRVSKVALMLIRIRALIDELRSQFYEDYGFIHRARVFWKLHNRSMILFSLIVLFVINPIAGAVILLVLGCVAEMRDKRRRIKRRQEVKRRIAAYQEWLIEQRALRNLTNDEQNT